MSGYDYCDAMGPRVFAHALRLPEGQCGPDARWREETSTEKDAA